MQQLFVFHYMFTYSLWVTWMLYNHDNCRNIWEKCTWLNMWSRSRSLHAPSIFREVEWRSRIYHRWSDGGPTLGGIPPATCHPYPTSARRWANGGIPPATCHPYPTSARRSGAIWAIIGVMLPCYLKCFSLLPCYLPKIPHVTLLPKKRESPSII